MIATHSNRHDRQQIPQNIKMVEKQSEIMWTHHVIYGGKFIFYLTQNIFFKIYHKL